MALLALAAQAAIAADEVYPGLAKALGAHEHRLPGSTNFYAAVESLEQALRQAGLEPHRQTFDTLVPETTRCEFRINGRTVAPVYALGPNGIANNTTGGETLSGPVVWLGSGTHREMNGKDIEGCIAVLRFDSPNMDEVFSQGAAAVVFVGDGTESQWQVRNHFLELDFSVPRLFVSRETAEEFGLTGDGANLGRGELSVSTVWKDAETCNVWTVIPGTKDAVFELGKEEAIVLTATLDTFGTVPRLSPGSRQAANAALLADVAARLSQEMLTRTVLVVFLGSHYGAQDGARAFYFPIDKAESDSLQSIESRTASYRNELQNVGHELQILAASDLFASGDKLLFKTLQLIRRNLDARVAKCNFMISRYTLERKRKSSLLDAKALAELEEKAEALKKAKHVWNNLRQQLSERKITDGENFRIVVEATAKDLVQRKSELERLIRHSTTDRELAAITAGKAIVGQYGFDFSDASANWLFNNAGACEVSLYHSLRTPTPGTPELGPFQRNLAALNAIHDTLAVEPGRPHLFSDNLRGLVAPNQFCLPGMRSTSAVIPQSLGIPGYQMMTMGNALEQDELPYRADVNLGGLAPYLAEYCRALATRPELSQRSPLRHAAQRKDTVFYYQGEGIYGVQFMTYSEGSGELEGPAHNAVAAITPGKAEFVPPMAGQSRTAMARVQSDGWVLIPQISINTSLRALGYDATGRFNQFPELGDGWFSARLFYGYGGGFFTPYLPAKYGAFSPNGKILNAVNDSNFKYTYKKFNEKAGTAYFDRDVNIKMIDDTVLVLGAMEAKPEGIGVPYSETALRSLNLVRQSAYDYNLLNTKRLQLLRDKEIVNDSLETLHSDASEHLELAAGERQEKNIWKAFAHELFAASIGARVAGPLRDISNDMVRAVVLLLVLTIPFAFVMERLCFSFVSIYKQVCGFAGFFLATFGLLYLVHPAFSLATSPIVIFLAFFIILMSCTVIYIMMGKFKHELRSIQGLASTVHGAASDSSTALAAVLIGISGMRNRPLKTILAGTTVIILTFTILVFASFTSRVGVVKSYLGKGEGGNRIELHRYSFMGLPPALVSSIEALYKDQWHVLNRQAAFITPQTTTEPPGNVVLNPENSKWVKLDALMSFDPREPALNPRLAEWMPGFTNFTGKTPPLFLAPAMAQVLGVSPGDEVSISGKRFIYAGPFDAAGLGEGANLDGSGMTPPDFSSTFSEMSIEVGKQSTATSDLDTKEQVDVTNFIYFPSRAIGITVNGALDEMGGVTTFLALYPKAQIDPGETARQLAEVFVGPVIANAPNGVTQYFFTKSLQASGFAEVIVPLLLGGLIIFSSLLGSLVEREKEIFTYSALGLAPPDVGTLFLAESSVYAIVGAVGGYLFSQLVAKALSLCGAYGLFSPPEMNFSSLSSVLTILVVMGTVLLSSIYPAIKAGKSANPGVARKWRMPAPQGDSIRFVFPFTVSRMDMTGILGFIREHFENHGDSSLGNFAATRVQLTRAPGGGEGQYGIRAVISLAPFDLGVSETFHMYSKPSEIAGIDEVVVELNRVSGTAGGWLRGNRDFISELRNQFLLWRSLPPETVEHYRRETVARMAGTRENIGDV